ncbi:aminotransferase family protein [[Clostridium] polysaccharolyticum]|uniref:Adenosylmethionine-8-amino-7-oxononanoate aminotransferase n=1 Tax=[Clostridium] polysaccharolyticum TaxID=29364 RepID=A0A1I0BDI6_9FIRM|nr:aspartate aminotransferase family protein [[Clostridium] polysaccharolyticum]SET04894.1 Adenosylmethionine-8-amino-7-oxononanoate aminotransferase [[Clostridium] polysaccharolyticum]
MENKIQKIYEEDKKVLHPLQHVSSHGNPLIVERGEGVYLYSVEGKKILDAFAGMWNVNIGYGNKEVAQAAYDQMCKIAYGSNFSGSSTLPQIELAQKLEGYAYPNLRTTFFTCGGSESNDSAFKTAQYYWKRKGKKSKTKIICLNNSYHGMTMAAASATGIPKFWNMFEKIPGFVHVPNANPYRFTGDVKEGETIGQAAARAFEEAVLKEGPDTVAAFIAEPVQGSGGGIVPPCDYFPLIREICNKYEILMIADEVITGFGRTGKMFAHHHWNVQPDILSFAKGITSGYAPLGGIQVTDEINEVIQNASSEEAWLHGFTYSGHAASCAVALKNLEIIEKNNLLQNVNNMGSEMADACNEIGKLDCVGNVRNIGLLSTIEFVKNRETKEQDFALAGQVTQKCLDMGVRVRTLANAISIAPPFIINKQEMDIVMNTIKEAIESCK